MKVKTHLEKKRRLGGMQFCEKQTEPYLLRMEDTVTWPHINSIQRLKQYA